MKRTLVTALLLPFFLLTVGSLGCKAAALPLSAPVAAVMAEEGLSSTQQSACYSQQAGALEQLTRQKTRQLWEEHLSDALPQTARQQLEDWYWQEPFEQNRWDWGEVWQQLNRSIQDKLRTLLHELLDEPLRLLGTLIGMVVLCAVLGAMRQNGTASEMDDPFGVVAAASALVLLGAAVGVFAAKLCKKPRLDLPFKLIGLVIAIAGALLVFA